jgi:hypothetical protein
MTNSSPSRDKLLKLLIAPLALPLVFRYTPHAVPKLYILSFHTHDDRRPAKFSVLADSMKSAINMAWEHGDGGASHPVTNTYRYKKEPHTCPQSYFVILLE